MAKILLIEDDRAITDLYQTRFMKEGYDILTTSDGESGLNLIESSHPDVVLLDVMIPKKSGLEIMKIVNTKASLKKIKFIALTNLDDELTKKQLEELGINKYIVKANFKPSEVVALVKEVLGE